MFNDQCSLLFDAAPTWFNSLDKSIASISDKTYNHWIGLREIFTGHHRFSKKTHMFHGWNMYQHLPNINHPNLQCEAPKIAKLVYKSSNYGLWYL